MRSRISFILFAISIVLSLSLSVYATPVVAEATKASPNRVVSLKPNITQILMELGLGDRIVGVTKFCKMPTAQAQIIADYTSMNLEAIVRLKPDLILTSTENSQSRQYEALQAAGISLRILDFHTYAAFKESLATVGEIFGESQKAKDLVIAMDAKLARLKNINAPQNTRPKTFVVMVQRQPLMIAAGDTYISTLFTEAGLINNFGNNRVNYPVLDEEELVRDDATYIFDLTHDANTVDPHFLNKTVIPLQIEDFLATPQSVDNLEKVIHSLEQNANSAP